MCQCVPSVAGWRPCLWLWRREQEPLGTPGQGGHGSGSVREVSLAGAEMGRRGRTRLPLPVTAPAHQSIPESPDTKGFGHTQGQPPGQSARLGPACPPLQLLSFCSLQLALLQLDTSPSPHPTPIPDHCF